MGPADGPVAGGSFAGQGCGQLDRGEDAVRREQVVGVGEPVAVPVQVGDGARGVAVDMGLGVVDEQGHREGGRVGATHGPSPLTTPKWWSPWRAGQPVPPFWRQLK